MEKDSYNQEIDNKFKAYINLGSDVVVSEEVIVNPKSKNGYMTYDDVEAAAYDVIDEKYPEKTFPEAHIDKIEVFSTEDNAWVPVFRESDTEAIKECEKSKEHSKFLVLPDATYSLSKEAKLWLILKDKGLIDEDEEFDFDKMHSYLEASSSAIKDDCHAN